MKDPLSKETDLAARLCVCGHQIGHHGPLWHGCYECDCERHQGNDWNRPEPKAYEGSAPVPSNQQCTHFQRVEPGAYLPVVPMQDQHKDCPWCKVERLTARVETQEKAIAVNVREYLKLEADRDRLRAALSELLHWTVESHEIGGLTTQARNAAVLMARAALSSHPRGKCD